MQRQKSDGHVNMKESELTKEIKSLPRDISPPRDVWPGIRQRLQSRGIADSPLLAKPVWRVPAIAAGLVMALTTGILIGRGTGHDSGITPIPVTQAAPSVLEYALKTSLESTEREYQAALQELLPLGYSGQSLADDGPDSIRASWRDLQETENLLLGAIGEHPTNLFLSEKLLELKSRQLQFVKQLVMLEQNNWRKT